MPGQQWYLAIDGQQVGPIPEVEVINRLRIGESRARRWSSPRA